ncbi:MAG: D-alanine--D-alanine ligase [Candidatus Omnitrophica bacterium]|nr:D-alanine--D-alanine ligase [Candidatus Omnitrophota bacterium]MDD5310438.1 D-alanine--D-alanine ligase [Candidatus Omnitrophota bacterium]MDD5546718.1 D-alanine--D-alanine ligase [Candidatus Omnitrophota bacterium]
MDKVGSRIGVLMGGPSAERDVSLRSGRAITDALLSKGYNAIPMEIWLPTRDELRSAGIDVAFIALHGTFGEDGQIQTILEDLRIPYTGSKVKASRLGMDKIASRKLFKKAGLNIPGYHVIENGARPKLKFPAPVVVKPSAQGSSVGVSIIDKVEGLDGAIKEAFKFGEQVILEEFIHGKELTVGVVDDKPLPVIQVVPKRRYYDEVAKYTAGMTDYLCPAPISEGEARLAQDAGIRAHNALGCRSFSRVDMILDDGGKIVVLEVNTIPGMTQLSLLPKAAKTRGMDFPLLCEKMLESAYK